MVGVSVDVVVRGKWVVRGVVTLACSNVGRQVHRCEF